MLMLSSRPMFIPLKAMGAYIHRSSELRSCSNSNVGNSISCCFFSNFRCS